MNVPLASFVMLDPGRFHVAPGVSTSHQFSRAAKRTHAGKRTAQGSGIEKLHLRLPLHRRS